MGGACSHKMLSRRSWESGVPRSFWPEVARASHGTRARTPAAVREQHVKVHVQIQGRSEALDHSHAARVTADASPVERAHVVDEDRQRGCHQRGTPRELHPLIHRKRQHPLPDGDFREQALHHVRGALRHSATPTARAEGPALARHRHHPVDPACVASDPQEPLGRITTGHRSAQLVEDVRRHVAARLLHPSENAAWCCWALALAGTRRRLVRSSVQRGRGGHRGGEQGSTTRSQRFISRWSGCRVGGHGARRRRLRGRAGGREAGSADAYCSW